jgi:hypothetical protein
VAALDAQLAMEKATKTHYEGVAKKKEAEPAAEPQQSVLDFECADALCELDDHEDGPIKEEVAQFRATLLEIQRQGREAEQQRAAELQIINSVQAALAAWRVELWFFPRWLRAGVFIAATVASVFTFAEIQAWAETRNSPTIYGIDPWSFVFGLVASFFLTNLPLIGFDHFLAQVFRPLRHRYRRLVRRKGWGYTILNWLIALRPARRRAELERKRFMRRWHDAERRLAGASHTTPARQQSGGAPVSNVPVSNAPVSNVPPRVTREPTPAANPPTALDRTRN